MLSPEFQNKQLFKNGSIHYRNIYCFILFHSEQKDILKVGKIVNKTSKSSQGLHRYYFKYAFYGVGSLLFQIS